MTNKFITRTSLLWTLILTLFGTSALHAFPPAPNFTIYGIVRDQVGVRIPSNGTASIVLLKQGIKIGQALITNGFIDYNYELQIRVDANRPGTEPYKASAYLADEQLALAVELNGQLFYPIEVSGDLSVGQGGERLRLDLNLGEDKDGDGIPDTWEEWQLYQSGQLPNNLGQWDLTQISADGDFDKDGQLDWAEYIAGTFAGDHTDVFYLKINEFDGSSSHFEFYQITGKVYVLEQSYDLVTWTQVPFSVGSAAAVDHHSASAVGVVSAQVSSSSSSSRSTLFRLTVR